METNISQFATEYFILVPLSYLEREDSRLEDDKGQLTCLGGKERLL